MKKNPQFHIFPNITNDDYLGLMKHSELMIGNSSAGIREAPSFHLPAINIGTRQSGRLRAANVIDVPNDVDAITQAINKALNDKSFKEFLKHSVNPYGDGSSAKRIVDILEKVDLNNNLIQKRITY
jgi:UDP-N-acetylglucosamine 2-epimerase (non-hydrolysing)/GDP/UDP-N,N'-diacetylbacillosamine 2-epimerase (hydrolysing)